MDYIVVDTEAASRGSFPTLGDARDWAYSLQQSNPELLEELLIERYRPNGEKVGESEWADDFLRQLNEALVPLEPGDGSLVVLRADLAQALRVVPAHRMSWSGTGLSTLGASFRSRKGAIETLALPPADTAVGSTERLQLAAL